MQRATQTTQREQTRSAILLLPSLFRAILGKASLGETMATATLEMQRMSPLHSAHLHACFFQLGAELGVRVGGDLQPKRIRLHLNRK